MLRSWLLFFSIVFSGLTMAHAERLPLRGVTLEWDAIEGASYYDVEISDKDKARAPKTSLTQEPIWKGKLQPGFYLMRVRGKDHRKVPGDWSEVMEVTVQLEVPHVEKPGQQFRLDSKKNDEDDFNFQWKKVPGAKKYVLTLESDDKSFQKEIETDNLEQGVTLPIGHKISWKLVAKNNKGLESEAPAEGEIEAWGPELAPPVLKKPENRFVRELNWDRGTYEKAYGLRFDRWDPVAKKWKEVESQPKYADNKFDFPAGWQGGTYRMVARSLAPYRKDSKLVAIQFPVAAGDRSPAAENRALLLESINRTKGWFFIASYLVTNMSYSGRNSDNFGGALLQVNLPSNFGGTGRLGLGYLSEKNPWGFLGIVDVSGFIVAGQNPKYASLEGNAVYRTPSGEIGEIRQELGGFYKETPEIIAQSLNQIDRVDTISGAGVHYGAEYWWALTPKLGFQVNGHLYPTLFSVHTPNGNPVSPTLSYQVGLLGSYRLTRSMTGLMGYAYRKDTQSYSSMNSDKNTISITGHYLNLFLEWEL